MSHTPPTLEVADLSCGHGAALLSQVSFSLSRGEALAIVGPNGAGKTTLLRTLAGQLPLLGGTIRVDGVDLTRLSAIQRARRVAFLSQDDAVDPGLTVEELVQLGRTPHLGLWGRPGPRDDNAVGQALSACQLTELAHRGLDHISGGERQRARIAMTLAQQTALLLLDEPVTHLDLRRRMELFELLSSLREQRQLTLLMVLHDLPEAYREADRVLVLGEAGASLVPASPEHRIPPLG